MEHVMKEWETSCLEGVSLSSKDLQTVSVLEKTGRLFIKQYASCVVVKAGSYVGAVHLDSVDIIIQPKLTDDHLLYKLFAYTLELTDLQLFAYYADLSTEKGWITDLLVMSLVKEIDDILLKGLLRRYREEEDNLSILRGKIDFARLAGQYARGAIAIPCCFEDYSTNILENRILLATLSLVFPWVSSPVLLSRVAFLREMLSVEVVADQSLASLFCELDRKEDRLGHYYKQAIQICYLIHQAMVFAFSGKETTAYPAFLFDMSALFEKFLFRLLSDCAPPGYYLHWGTGMGGYYGSIERNITPLKPDYQIFYQGKRVCIADAKYKLYDQRRIDPGDLYQLTVYYLSGAVDKVAIFYPAQKKVAGYYELRGSDGNSLVKIEHVGIQLETILERLDGRGNLNEKAREEIWAEIVNI